MSKKVGSSLVETGASIYVDGCKPDVDDSGVEMVVLENRTHLKKELKVMFKELSLRQEYVFVPHKREEYHLVEFPLVEDLALRIVLKNKIREKYSRIKPDRFIIGLLSGEIKL